MRGSDYLKTELLDNLVFIAVAFVIAYILYLAGVFGPDVFSIFSGTFALMTIAGMLSTYITYRITMRKVRKKRKKG